MLLDINEITIHCQVVLTSSKFIVSTNVYRAIITALIERHCDEGICTDLSQMISSKVIA